MAATVIGFGGRAPVQVLEVLSESIQHHAISSSNVTFQRSPKIVLSLHCAPYRVFLSSQDKKANPPATKLLLYCLPTTVSEYLAFSHDANQVRSAILSSSSFRTTNSPHTNAKIVVAIYDPISNSFLGATTPSDVSFALRKPSYDSHQHRHQSQIHSNLAATALSALSKLESQAASQLHSTTKRRDTVLVIGSGGREHALAVALTHSPLIEDIICCPGNGGTAAEKEGGKISNAPNVKDNKSILNLVKNLPNVSMVVVGPEQPLVNGLVDDLKVEFPHIKAFGPTSAAAELEASKAFTKHFLVQHGIPTAKYRSFDDVSDALTYVTDLDENDRQVVKASGLAAGKGVLLPQTKEELITAVKTIMSDKAFGNAGDTCIIETFLTGPEASCLAFCDGKTAILMPPAQDHKRALDGDLGLNTGGMGAYAPAPCVTPQLWKEIEGICVKTVKKMAELGTPYVGVLYAGVMLTPNGPSVLEFNCRFGDPETQVLLPLLESDLYEVMMACCNGTLDSIDVSFLENTCAATVVCAAKGYPEKYPKGMEILGLVSANALPNVKVYHAGTKLDHEQGVTRCSGGRVLAVTGVGPTLKDALACSYQGVRKIDFVRDEDDDKNNTLLYHRTDIAKGAIDKKLRIGVLGSTRGTSLLPIIDACRSGALHAEIVAVISNKNDALILKKGRSLGVTVTTKYVSSKGLSRNQYDAECTSMLLATGADLVILIGYMRILSKQFCEFWAGRCINVHPSLLPNHAGGMDLEVHQAVIDAGETETGCTIHKVTEDVDGGPILVQSIVQVSPNDTAESLKTKVQLREGPAFIEAISKYYGKQVISYADAGVNIDAGNNLVEMIKPACESTRRPGCDAELGGFGGLFDLAAAGYDSANTILIGATDGVGTKLHIAQTSKKHDFVGIDLVAMCVNDLIVTGGEPLFFLDYYATGSLNTDEAATVVRSIAKGCRMAGCGLIGGETAEMPSMYSPGAYDLAGFSLGAVEKSAILPREVGAGDVLLGLSSSGVHSNGFSLVRKLIVKEKLTFDSACPWDAKAPTVADSLLVPTKIYVKSCLPLLKNSLLNGMAHITGGGLIENLPRCLPQGVVAEITGFPPLPNVFKWLKKASGLNDTEMLRTFNCGIGMVLIVKSENVNETKSLLSEAKEEVFDLGVLVTGSGEQVVVKSILA